MNMLHLKHWEVSCPISASIMVEQWEPGRYHRKWDSTEDNTKAKVQLRHTLPLLPYQSLYSLCVTKVTLWKGTFFFFLISSSGSALHLHHQSSSELWLWHFNLFSYSMSQISLHQTNDHLIFLKGIYFLFPILFSQNVFLIVNGFRV